MPPVDPRPILDSLLCFFISSGKLCLVVTELRGCGFVQTLTCSSWNTTSEYNAVGYCIHGLRESWYSKDAPNTRWHRQFPQGPCVGIRNLRHGEGN